jgi:hypothetical protein
VGFLLLLMVRACKVRLFNTKDVKNARSSS